MAGRGGWSPPGACVRAITFRSYGHAYRTRVAADTLMKCVARLSAVDLAYLRAHPLLLTTFLRHQRIRETPVHGGSICQAVRLTLEDGASVFVKFLNDPTDESPSRA